MHTFRTRDRKINHFKFSNLTEKNLLVNALQCLNESTRIDQKLKMIFVTTTTDNTLLLKKYLLESKKTLESESDNKRRMFLL